MIKLAKWDFLFWGFQYWYW